MRISSICRFVVLFALVLLASACSGNPGPGPSPTYETKILSGFTYIRPAGSVTNPSQVDAPVRMIFTFPITSGSFTCNLQLASTEGDGSRVYRCNDNVSIPVHNHSGEERHIVNASDPARAVGEILGSNQVADQIIWPNGQMVSQIEAMGNGKVGRYIQLKDGNIQ